MSPEELRERLKRAGLTPYRLSYLLGVEPNEGSKWTRGDRPVPKGRVAQIIELTDFVAEHGAAAVPLPALVRTANARIAHRETGVLPTPYARLVRPAVTRPEPVVSPHSPSRDGRPSTPYRNCDRRLGRASARFTPTSFAPIISPASAALRDKARDPFSGSPSSQHEAGDAAGEIEACENAGPINRCDGGENIEGVGHGRYSFFLN